ncbi:MAG: FKBP-type peptidyl-prolyl cis-trans isomerase [Planctomycetota bacterium]
MTDRSPSKSLVLSTAMLGTLLMAPTQLVQVCEADETTNNEKTSVTEPIGYFLGVSVGQSFANQGFQSDDFDIAALSKGIADAFAGGELALTPDELAETQGKITALLRKRQQERTENKVTESKAWMTRNADAKDVKSFPNGLQYKVLKSGKGESPAADDTVKVHYTGKLTNGKVFDSSVQRGQPASFQVNRVIQGWQQALQEMKVGDKWMLYIPPELGYGASGAGEDIGPHEVLVFEVELLDIL